MSRIQLVLVDFDGTLIKGDSTSFAYRVLYSSKLSFIIGYYLRHIFGLAVLIFTGNYDYLRESRRSILASRFKDLEKSEFGYHAQKRMFEEVYSHVVDYLCDDSSLVIISAGYSEIIRLIMGENLNYELIANSLFDKETEVINFENKIKRLDLKFKSPYFVKAAFGNTNGDIPMLKLAENAFWVDANGRVSKFSN